MSERATILRRMGIAVAALAALCALVGTLLAQSHADVRDAAVTAASNIAATVSQDEVRNIELLDLSLQGVADAMGDGDVRNLSDRLQRLILFDRAASAKDIDSVMVLDTEGSIVIESHSVVPRVKRFGSSDFFRVHTHETNHGLFISRPFLSPFDDTWCLGLSRRLNHADGSFAGVVVGILKLDYIQRLFEPLDVGPHGTVNLIGHDGTIVMRQPYDDGQIGRVINITAVMDHVRAAPIGTYESRSPIDGIERLILYQQVGTLPLVTVVGFSIDDLYGPWRQKAALVIGVLALFCAAIGGLVFYLQRELDRRIKAEAAFAQLAATDKLTGLPNRRKFDEVLELEWQRSRRSGLPISLLMIDVDHFKAYNDEYGHLGGDAVLASFGIMMLANLVRNSDFAARFGGEEFAIILPGSDESAARVVAERVRAKVESWREPHRGSPRGFVSVSVGVASLQAEAGQNASDLIARADVALYGAKAAGRNRVEIAAAPALMTAA